MHITENVMLLQSYHIHVNVVHITGDRQWQPEAPGY
jgi:hypothetical protein